MVLKTAPISNGFGMRNFHSVAIDLRGAEGLFDILEFEMSSAKMMENK